MPARLRRADGCVRLFVWEVWVQECFCRVVCRTKQHEFTYIVAAMKMEGTGKRLRHFIMLKLVIGPILNAVYKGLAVILYKKE